IRCAVGRREEVAAALAGDPASVTVEIAAGSHDLMVDMVTPDLAAFSRYLFDRVERVPAVTGTTVAVATQVITEASQWRLDALDPGQTSALGGGAGFDGVDRPSARQLSALDCQLLTELGQDGRRPWHQLAVRTGT